MASAAFPSVIAAIMSKAQTALVDVRVVRGRDITDGAGDVVLVGAQNVDDISASAGAFQQTMQTFGGAREEVGAVNCLVVSRNGQSDQDLACSTAFDYLAAIEAAVRADKTLGLTAFDYVVAEFQAGDVTESQTAEGTTSTELSFSISYKIRI